MNLPKYLVFSGASDGPKGGWLDLRDAKHTMEAALLCVLQSPHTWWHIVDTSTNKIVKSSDTK